MLRPACLLPAAQLSPPHGLLTPRSGTEVSFPSNTWGLLPGAPTDLETRRGRLGDAPDELVA